MLKIIFLLLLVITTFSVSSAAFEFSQYQTPDVIIQYEPPLKNAAVKLSQSYLIAKNNIETKIGWKIEFIPTVILIHKNKEFQKGAHNDLITAFALPVRKLIVIDYSKMDRTPFDLKATLEHELCHLLLHQNIKTSDMPKWLDEGIAQWASGGTADIINPGEKNILKQAVLSNNLLSFKDISLSFPEQSRLLLLSYEESKSFIEYIVKKYSEVKMLSILNSLKQGKSIEQAVNENLSIEFNLLEKAWQQSLIKKYSWPKYIADNIYWILFFAAGLATFAGYFVLRRRMKNYRDEEDEVSEEMNDK